jgi:diguanylate cyclase (GGDEF)-like protein
MTMPGTAEAMQRVCRLAARLVGAPISVLTLVDRHRLEVVASTGVDRDALDLSLCRRVGESGVPLVSPEYLGVPLRLGAGAGALSALDHGPREWGDAEVAALSDLALLLTDQVEHQRALEERDALAQRLRCEQRQDALTGLGNRRLWLERAPAELSRAEREGTPTSAVIIDLDHFKAVNDTYGHDAGDRLLRALGRLWRPLVRQPDVLVRWGGDEFAVLLAHASAAEARQVAARLAFVAADISRVTAGVAEWDGAEDAAALLGRADEDLLRAKRFER